MAASTKTERRGVRGEEGGEEWAGSGDVGADVRGRCRAAEEGEGDAGGFGGGEELEDLMNLSVFVAAIYRFSRTLNPQPLTLNPQP
jgi:hypothetical protein